MIPRHPVISENDDWGVQSPPKGIVSGFHNHSQVSQDFLGDLKNREGSPILASPLPLILSDVKNHIKSKWVHIFSTPEP